MKNPDELLGITEQFEQVKILVVGDVMLDRYWWGNASRLSPEAPVPVVALNKVTNIPGGAANVAANIAGLGAEVFLVGVIGADDSGKCLSDALESSGISPDFLVACEKRPTTAKTRVLVHNQQIARIDDETSAMLASNDEETLFAVVAGLIAETDLIVLSDYAKGCLTPTLIQSIVAEAAKNGKQVLVDPKGKNFAKYNGATLLTPNLVEALNAAGADSGAGEEAVDEAAQKLLGEIEIESLLITLGEHGMKLFRRDDEPIHFPSMARQVFDVTGAGDTVIASLAVALGTKADVHSAISLANVAAGLSVEKVGTSTIPLEELRHALLFEATI
jgi:D-beta-D-heptose 7-phosphate kinase/D-beta-D-heptose 1-phosphate adenosyltransferase